MLFMTKLNPEKHIAPLMNSDISIEGDETTKELFKLCQLTQKDLEALAKIDDIMEEHAANIAKRHYDMIMMIPEIKEIFNEHTTFEAYTRLIAMYYKQLTKPKLDTSYVKYRKKIGQIHSRIHLTDEWFVGSYVRVYEYMFPLIVSRFHSKPDVLSNVLTALNRIITLDSLIVLGSYQEANDYYLVENVSKVMDSVMGTDKVGGLLDDVASTVEETSSISSAAIQLSASVQEVADNATTVSGNTVKMIDESQVGQEVIKGSLDGFLKMADDFNSMEEKIEHLIHDVQEVTKIVELIKNIADETNLLALNASIEAARAGESGRGFSVVASEVRELAEQTKASVKQISTTIAEIQTDSQDVGTTVEKMSSVLKERVEQANKAIGSMAQIMEQIKAVGESTSNIAAIAQEQSAATQDITDRMVVVHDHTGKIKEGTNITGESIYQASLEVDELRKSAIDAIPQLTGGQLIRVVQTEHRLWRWWLYNTLLGYHTEDLRAASGIENCRLSQWIKQVENDQDGAAMLSFKTLRKLHEIFHSKVEEIAQMTKREQEIEAKEIMLEFETLSTELLDALEKLQVEYHNLTNDG